MKKLYAGLVLRLIRPALEVDRREREARRAVEASRLFQIQGEINDRAEQLFRERHPDLLNPPGREVRLLERLRWKGRAEAAHQKCRETSRAEVYARYDLPAIDSARRAAKNDQSA